MIVPTLGTHFNHKGTTMIPRELLNNITDSNHGVINGLKAMVDMQHWFAGKFLDEVERYTKIQTSALNSLAPCKPNTKSAD